MSENKGSVPEGLIRTVPTLFTSLLLLVSNRVSSLMQLIVRINRLGLVACVGRSGFALVVNTLSGQTMQILYPLYLDCIGSFDQERAIQVIGPTVHKPAKQPNKSFTDKRGP